MTVLTSGCCSGPLEQLVTEKLNQPLSFSKLSQGTSPTHGGLGSGTGKHGFKASLQLPIPAVCSLAKPQD